MVNKQASKSIHPSKWPQMIVWQIWPNEIQDLGILDGYILQIKLIKMRQTKCGHISLVFYLFNIKNTWTLLFCEYYYYIFNWYVHIKKW